jgi:hypothetical protein
MTANEKDQLSDTWPTIFELASTIPSVDLKRLGRQGGGRKNAPPVTQGLIPKPFPTKEGYFEVTPEQLASLRVPKIEVNGTVRGFQREKVNIHVRKIARALVDGEEMPPLIISIFPDGQAYVDDGQHRALAAIVARKNLEVVVKHRTVEQARKLFASQGKAKGLRSDDTLLTGDSPLELYIQDALTSDEHPWSMLVALNPSSTGQKMTPTTMGTMVGTFVYNAFNQGVNYYISRPDDTFDPRLADQLAEMVRVFGNRATNPLAFRGRTLRAISYAATHVFRRNLHTRPDDYERWLRHMPTFDFSKYPHLLSKETDMAGALVAHWNKRLPAERRVEITTYH